MTESRMLAAISGPGKPRGPNAPRSGAPPKVLPIDVPAISMGELNNITGNFGQKALIGEGSYGQIYRAVLTSGEPVAIKKLDPSVSNDSEADFSAQVSTTSIAQCPIDVHQRSNFVLNVLLNRFGSMQLSMVSRLNNEYFIQLMGYYLDESHRILVYQFATHGSLHDTLHGTFDGLCYNL